MSTFDTVVLFIEGRGPIGGAERVGFTTAELLLKKGFRVHIISSEEELDERFDGQSNFSYSCMNLGMVWERWFESGKIGMVKTALSEPLIYHRVRKELHTFDHESTIVHFHGYHSKFGHEAIESAVSLGFRTTVTCHDYGFVCPNTMLYDYAAGCVCSEKALSLGCWNRKCMGEQGNRLKHFRFLRTLSKHSVDRTFKQLKSIIAVSEFQKSIFSKVSPTLPEIIVVHNPVTPASHEQCSPELSNEFVWIGRMTDEKDPEIALIAAELANAKLNFVGDGPLSEKLRNASSSALFVGWKTPSEVCEIQKKSRALLMTSKCLETASLVVLECLAAGIPCIVPEKSAATSWVINGFNGLYFESGNAESLAKVISLMMDDNLCQQLGDNAYQSYWSKPFSEDSYIANLLEVYKKL